MSRPSKRTTVDHAKVAARLRAHPRMWLPVGEYRSTQSADGMARKIREGQPIGSTADTSHYQPAGAFEVRIDLTEFGALVVARYVGDPSAEDIAWADALADVTTGGTR